MTTGLKDSTGTASYRILRYVPIGLIFAGLIIVLLSGWHDYLTHEQLAANRQKWADFVFANYGIAMLIYLSFFILVVAFAIPGSAFMMILGGFSFGLYWGAALSMMASLIGGMILFLAARTAFADLLKRRAKGGLKKFQRNFHENAFSYLLFLRLIPILPHWLTNIAPGFFGVGLKTFIAATFFGMIPACVIYAGFGQGLDKFLQSGQRPDLNILFEPEIFWSLIGLAVLSLLPPCYREYKSRRKEKLANDKKTIHS